MVSLATTLRNQQTTVIGRLKLLLADYPDLIDKADQGCWDMLARAQVHSYKPDSLVFYECAECTKLLLITQGTVRVFKESADREVTLYRVHPGEICIHNLNNLVDGTHFSVKARTESSVSGLLIPRTVFQEGLAASASFRQYVIRNLTERLTDMANLVSGIVFDRLDLRVANWLLNRFQSSGGLPIKITHVDLAHELGSTREVISRILKEYEHKHAVQLSRGRIHLVSKEVLTLLGKGKPVE